MRILRKISREQRHLLRILTRAAVAFRVTMMIGQIGRYFEIRRADWPLKLISEEQHQAIVGTANLVVRTRIAPALISMLLLTADMATDSNMLIGLPVAARMSLNKLT